MHTFVSYATEYDHYKGENSIGMLTAVEQDELIRCVLEGANDFRELVVRKGIKKLQAEGLWAIVVFVGLALEEAKRIRSFQERTEKDIQEIISFLAGTKLWLRLEEAYPPFNSLPQKTDYPWSELEKIKIEVLTEATGEPLYKIKSKVCEYLSNTPSQIQSEVIDRMPYHAFKQTYDEGKLMLVVDKGLSPVVGRVGLIKNHLPLVFFFAFSAGLLAFIPIGIFVGFWYGVSTLVVSVACKRLTTYLLVKEIRKLAISNKEIYRWLMARKIIWLRYNWDSPTSTEAQ